MKRCNAHLAKIRPRLKNNVYNTYDVVDFTRLKRIKVANSSASWAVRTRRCLTDATTCGVEPTATRPTSPLFFTPLLPDSFGTRIPISALIRNPGPLSARRQSRGCCIKDLSKCQRKTCYLL